jgi:hypothetical protein
LRLCEDEKEVANFSNFAGIHKRDQENPDSVNRVLGGTGAGLRIGGVMTIAIGSEWLKNGNKIVTRAFRLLCLLLLIFVAVTTTYAQTETATISGLITDETGAVVPGAEVKLQSVERGAVRTTTTNNAGIYVFPSVQPGQYQIRVDKAGFKQVDFLGLIVNVQDHIEQNFRMQIGSVSESVTVSASDLHINTQDATVSTVIDRQFAENLPLNGRSFQTLIYLTPGVVVVPSNSNDSGQFSVNGQRASSNYWTVDGVSANNGVGSNGPIGNGLGGAAASFSALGGTNSLVSVDAMQEFRILTSTYAPEFGRTPGGQISIVTRSGTNQWHGSAFDYLRNDVFDANDWFADSVGQPKPPERQNDFGGTVGGPILKDKTFFFFSYEGLRLRLPQVALETVPCDSTCSAAGNVRAMAVPAMQPFLNAFPLPNGPEVLDASGNPTGAAQFNKSYSNQATLDAYSIRLDHKWADRLNIFGRYNYSPSQLLNRGGAGGGFALSVVEPARITMQTATVGATWAISTAATNDVRFNYSRTNAFSHEYLDNFGGAVPLPSLPLPSGGFTSQNSVFTLGINSLKTGVFLSVGQNGQTLQRQINVVDNLSVQKGSHSLKFGIDFRRLSPLIAPAIYSQPPFFADVFSAESGSNASAQIMSQIDLTLLFHDLSVFAQDTWRVAPRLTVTYGLRWDVEFAPSSINGPSLIAVTGYSLTNFSNLAIAPAGTPPFHTTYGNVAPRIGLAYQLSQNQQWQSVIRGGFGVFYDLVSSEVGNSFTNSRPPFGAFGPPLSGPFPYTAAQIAPPVIPTTGTLANFSVFNPNLKQPYTLEWNIALEQALGQQQTLSASYIGAAGRRLLQTSTFIGPPTQPNIQNGQFVDNTSTSDYDALQLQFQRRLSHGLQALASYTWSHSFDTGSAGSINANTSGADSAANANRGNSSFDIRNTFSAGLTYDLPSPKFNAFTNAVLRGWSLQNIILARSAPPVDITDSSFFTFNTGVFAEIRPDLVPGQSVYLHGPQFPGGKAFNPAAFVSVPSDPVTGAPLRQGDLGRNALRGFAATQWDFAVHRDFPIHESLKLQFRAEMFNVLNHPNFGQPSGSFASGGFGLSNSMLGRSLAVNNLGSGGFNPLYQIGGPRSIQFALKLMF